MWFLAEEKANGIRAQHSTNEANKERVWVHQNDEGHPLDNLDDLYLSDTVKGEVNADFNCWVPVFCIAG
jgi:hypothetical protein